ncbi:MAG: hypothetical protein CM1200mP27_12510 [Chloroflexota bacterium]|nr:MAG: hypothetical protein CM1200mP27_12510 [Chloroflexota bacterium]
MAVSEWCSWGTSSHATPLNLVAISAFDSSPEKTLEQKRDLLSQAESQGWLLVFSHGHDVKAGYLERRGEMGYLRPVDL